MFIFVGFITGHIYSVKDSKYIPGIWSNYTAVIPAFCYIYIYVLLFRLRKKLENREFIIIIIYFIIPLIEAIIQIFVDDFEFSYVSAAYSLFLAYVVLQADSIAEIRLREKVLQESNYIDYLTGIKNRRAYEDIVKESYNCQKLGIVFCDINSLKYINDTKGYLEGDKIIVKFSRLLKKILTC